MDPGASISPDTSKRTGRVTEMQALSRSRRRCHSRDAARTILWRKRWARIQPLSNRRENAVAPIIQNTTTQERKCRGEAAYTPVGSRNGVVGTDSARGADMGALKVTAADF